MDRIIRLLWSRTSRVGRRQRGLLRAALATLALTLAIVPGVAPAQAQAQRIPLTGQDLRLFGMPGRVWVADGLTQIRELPQTGTFTFSGGGVTLSGTETDLLLKGTLVDYETYPAGQAPPIWDKSHFTGELLMPG